MPWNKTFAHAYTQQYLYGSKRADVELLGNDDAKVGELIGFNNDATAVVASFYGQECATALMIFLDAQAIPFEKSALTKSGNNKIRTDAYKELVIALSNKDTLLCSIGDVVQKHYKFYDEK